MPGAQPGPGRLSPDASASEVAEQEQHDQDDDDDEQDRFHEGHRLGSPAMGWDRLAAERGQGRAITRVPT